MKITKTADKYKIEITKAEWQKIGHQQGWLKKTAQYGQRQYDATEMMETQKRERLEKAFAHAIQHAFNRQPTQNDLEFADVCYRSSGDEQYLTELANDHHIPVETIHTMLGDIEDHMSHGGFDASQDMTGQDEEMMPPPFAGNPPHREF